MMFRQLHAFFLKLPPAGVFALAIMSTCLVMAVDHLTGVELSFSIFYLAPIVFVAWYGGHRLAYLSALIAAVTWLVVDLSGGRHYSHVMIGVWNAGVRLGFFLIVAHLLSRVRRLLDQLQSLAETDGLTGLKNPRSFNAALRSECDRAKRYRRPLTLAFFDLDNFKSVNDRFGHEAGDALLQQVALVLQRRLRRTDVAGRLGGDEFVLLLPEVSPADARRALEKLQHELLAAMAERDWPVTFSIGVVTAVEGVGAPGELLREADALMYRVKKEGKGALRHELRGSAGEGGVDFSAADDYPSKGHGT